MKHFFLLLAVLLTTLISKAQWLDVYGGTSIGSTFILYTDSTDGILYVGGSFDTVGPNYFSSRGFATWGGLAWGDLSGVFGNDFTQAVTRYNGQIYHGVKTGSVYVGEQSLENRVGQLNDHVLSLIVYNGELYAGGNFTSFDTSEIPLNHIARYDGTQWKPVGSGFRSKHNSPKDGIYAMCIYDNKLYAGGIFDTAGSVAANNIAVWDGNEWNAVGGGVDQTGTNRPKVAALCEYHGRLVVAGLFNTAGGLNVSNIARWDGAVWSSGNGAFDGEVDALCVYNDDLYAGGYFGFDGQEKNHIAVGDGNDWLSVGGGITNGQVVRTLAVWNGMLLVGGKFDEIEDTIVVSNLAAFAAPSVEHHYLPPSEDDFVVTPDIISGSSVIHLVGSQVMKKAEVTNKYGAVISSYPFKNSSYKANFQLDAYNWSPGVYFIKIYTPSGVVNKKIIII